MKLSVTRIQINTYTERINRCIHKACKFYRWRYCSNPPRADIRQQMPPERRRGGISPFSLARLMREPASLSSKHTVAHKHKTFDRRRKRITLEKREEVLQDVIYPISPDSCRELVAPVHDIVARGERHDVHRSHELLHGLQHLNMVPVALVAARMPATSFALLPFLPRVNVET